MEPIDSCKHVPNLLSSFVDTFVDFSVTDGLFLPPNSNSNSQNQQNAPHPKNDENAPGDIRTHYPSPPGRLIAIGDLHSDLAKTKQAFRLANLIDASGNWTGGSTTVVQVGDVLDRGGDEIKILYFLERLRRQAEKTGGKVITMNGNHEIMNVESDFQFVDKSGLKEFRVWAEWYRIGQVMKGLCEGLESPKDVFKGIPFSFRGIDNENGNNEALIQELRARIAALRPNGPISARFLSRNVTVLVIGDSVFVHGGLLPKHVEYGLQRINEEVRDWINGLGGERAPGYCRQPDGVVWLRKFSKEKNCDCETLEHLLATIPGSKRMIMGHTIQKIGINGVCDNQAIRIDVGMSKGCSNGLPEVLEISENSGLRILTSNPLYQDKYKASSHSERKEGFGLLFPEQGPKQVEVKA